MDLLTVTNSSVSEMLWPLLTSVGDTPLSSMHGFAH